MENNNSVRKNGYFEKRITLGNILEILIIVASMFMAYFNLKGVQDRMQLQLDNVSAEFTRTRADLVYYLRMDVSAEQRKGVDEKLNAIIERLDRVEHQTK